MSLMSEAITAASNAAGGRAAVVHGLKVVKTSEEGGTKKEYEDFIEKIHSHVVVQWGFGSNIGHVIKKLEDSVMEEPADLTKDQE